MHTLKNKPQLSLILHNLRSSENVGSILRTADAVGLEKVYLSGITPAPVDRFGRPNARVLKASLGAEMSMPWEIREDTPSLIAELKQSGLQILALEQDGKSLDYRTVKLERDTALIVGNEVSGIEQDILSLADSIIEIPMRGKKESLNVSVACGVALFTLLR